MTTFAAQHYMKSAQSIIDLLILSKACSFDPVTLQTLLDRLAVQYMLRTPGVSGPLLGRPWQLLGFLLLSFIFFPFIYCSLVIKMQCGPHSLARSEKGIFPAANARLLPTTPQISTSVKQAEEQGYTHMRNEDNIGTASYDDITQNLLPPRLKRRLEKEKELIASYGAIRVKEYVPQRVNAIEVLQSPPPPPYAVIDHLLKPQPADDVDSEPLPPYSCSIHKSGMVSIKQECGKNGGVSMDRSWK